VYETKKSIDCNESRKSDYEKMSKGQLAMWNDWRRSERANFLENYERKQAILEDTLVEQEKHLKILQNSVRYF